MAWMVCPPSVSGGWVCTERQARETEGWWSVEEIWNFKWGLQPQMGWREKRQPREIAMGKSGGLLCGGKEHGGQMVRWKDVSGCRVLSRKGLRRQHYILLEAAEGPWAPERNKRGWRVARRQTSTSQYLASTLWVKIWQSFEMSTLRLPLTRHLPGPLGTGVGFLVSVPSFGSGMTLGYLGRVNQFDPGLNLRLKMTFGGKKVETDSPSFKVPQVKVKHSPILICHCLCELSFIQFLYSFAGKQHEEKSMQRMLQSLYLSGEFLSHSDSLLVPQVAFRRTQTKIPRVLSIKVSLSPITPFPYLPNCNAIIIIF